MHCHHFRPLPLNRRQMLTQCGAGIGALALAALRADNGYADDRGVNPWQPKAPHFPPRARSVIFLYMDGGPSHVDTFDYKPALAKYHGQEAHQVLDHVEATQFNNIGKVLKSPWDFRQYGESGAWVSDLFPHLARQVDKLCFIHSMISKFSEHTFANYFLHSGSGLQGRPSMGAWIGYGLGSECCDLPGFVVLNSGLIPPGGIDNFGNGFLSASYQASIFNTRDEPVAHIRPPTSAAAWTADRLRLLKRLDAMNSGAEHHHDSIEAAIANYETAFRMQVAVPELTDLSRETETTRELYGLNAEFANTQLFGRQCLLARRMVERGVRFIEVTCPDGNGDRWDQHNDIFDGHGKNCRTVDQPIAGLLTDLQQRGLLESTLVIWAGEFGRTPFAQGENGRDHNPFGFTCWLAGGGVKAGYHHGATDEWGYRAIQDRVEMHDLHATILHLLGLDHRRVTFRFSSRDMRLTDVYGNVLTEILA